MIKELRNEKERKMTFLKIFIFSITFTFLFGCWEKDITRSYYDTGELYIDASINSGLLDGKSTMYFKNGNVKGYSFYKNGILNGVSMNFYKNGKPKSRARYSNGYLNGISTSWNISGKIDNEVCFNEGKIIKVTKCKTN